MEEIKNRYHFDEKIHVHYLDDKPLCGTSTVESVLAKPLSWWASGKAMELLGWVNRNLEPNEALRLESSTKVLEEIKKMGPKTYLALLDKAYKNHSVTLKDSATAGTDLHALLEKWVKSKMQNQIQGTPVCDPEEQIMPFVDWCNKFVKRFLWSELHTYSESLWIGGITDCGVEMIDGKVGIIDFKSAKEVYFDHFVQCGGYALQLEENGGFDANGFKVFQLEHNIDFMAIVPFGAKNIVPTLNKNGEGTTVEDFKNSFKACLTIYKNKQKYNE